MFKKIARIIIALIIAAVSFSVTVYVLDLNFTGDIPQQVKWAIAGLITIVTALIGFTIAPLIINSIIQLTEWLEVKLQKTPTYDIVAGVIGIIIGLIIANLLGVSFSALPFVGDYIPMITSVVFGYVGWSVGTKKRDEILSVTNIFKFGKDKQVKSVSKNDGYKILDTSVIIDGRISDICKTGFVEGTLLIPGFVLEELRHIADSSDALKRNRGRRGLDILNKIRKELDIKVQIYEEDIADVVEVDSKLVRLAQMLNGQVVTNDYNLNKVAELQGVKVLNINELANAVKPIVLPGEEMVVQVIKDGKESGQGVAYLDDGTMIVVENGRKYINQTIHVIVTSVLQTAAGRMIFAKPKGAEKNNNGTKSSWGEVKAGALRN
ncbi:MAG: twitching motility protein PilT [Desulfitibacter sp. BRH_c19]|nr:MAG: twitching motility protein PilT [Desulfitibacter sp. BRH_c19]